VDGGYTLGQRDAVELIEQIHPRIVLPMHYFTQDTLARFLGLMRNRFAIDIRDTSVMEISRATLPAQPTVIALPGPH
jgi:L-ascorbate metabolism protein UlaG (beta-lactamase superfamily)